MHLRGAQGAVVQVSRGPRLLSHLGFGPGIEAHRALHGDLPRLSSAELTDLVGAVAIRGRGGAGFPLARKLEAVAGRGGRPVVVVNASEGEPASHKDMALALTSPHTVLDGAALIAGALGAREIHVVAPAEQPRVVEALRGAVAERRGRGPRVRWHLHEAHSRFVAGQARAVIELMSGRENLPVTSWQPEAHRGYHGRPTLLSNAETHAQVAVLARLGAEEYARLGTAEEPGTCLVTLDGDTRHPRVREVPLGTRWSDVLPPGTLAGPVLLGGYHGTWAAPGQLAGLTVSRDELSGQDLALGAGVVLPLANGDCPLHLTADIVGYLAGQSARRCGPCLNGLPALAEVVREVDDGIASVGRTEQLIDLVTRRGACAHPDGTARLVRSLLRSYGDEVGAHAEGECTFRGDATVAGDATRWAG